jgi:ABC-type microcin C transport system permease subunit YejB
MNYLKEILKRNPSMVIPALAAVAKMHKSNAVVAKQPTRIIAHLATIDYRSKLASQVKLKPYTSTELAELYGVDKNTLKKWIKPLKREIGKKHGEFYTARQVGVIFERLDFPHYNEVA